MKVKDFLNTFELIKEGYLASDYTWGFELEGICQDGEISYGDLPSYHSKSEPEGNVKKLKDKLDDLLNNANLISQNSIIREKEKKNIKGNIGSDSSVRPSPSKGGWAFEYATGVMQFSIKGALEVLRILYEELPDINVYTNNTCGFHTHASLPYLTKEDAVWLICCISCDDEIQKELTELNKDDVKIDFYDTTYAGKSFYNEIYNGLLNKNYKKVSDIVSGLNTYDDNGKYRNIRLHPEKGTLEWRGPRNFLNDNNYNLIKEYIYKFYRVLQYYSKILNAKKWEKGGIVITREEINKNVSMTTSFDTNVEKHKKNSLEKVAEKIRTDSRILLGLRPQQFVDIMNEYPNICININTSKVLNQIWNRSDERTLKFYMDNILDTTFIQWITLMDNNKLPFTTYIWMYDNFINYNENEIIVNHMNEFCEKYVLRYENASFSDKRKIVNYLKDNQDKIPMSFWSKLINSSYYALLYKLDIPEKIQRKLVKKNPYNIQVIKNPSQSIIDYVSKKIPDIDQYIPRI